MEIKITREQLDKAKESFGRVAEEAAKFPERYAEMEAEVDKIVASIPPEELVKARDRIAEHATNLRTNQISNNYVKYIEKAGETLQEGLDEIFADNSQLSDDSKQSSVAKR